MKNTPRMPDQPTILDVMLQCARRVPWNAPDTNEDRWLRSVLAGLRSVHR